MFIRRNFFSNFTAWHFFSLPVSSCLQKWKGEILHFSSVRQHFSFLSYAFYEMVFILFQVTDKVFYLPWIPLVLHWHQTQEPHCEKGPSWSLCKRHYTHPLGPIISHPFILLHSLHQSSNAPIFNSVSILLSFFYLFIVCLFGDRRYSIQIIKDFFKLFIVFF